MKKDNKVFVIFILIILVYGLMHYFDGIGKFVFSQQYSDFGLGLNNFQTSLISTK